MEQLDLFGGSKTLKAKPNKAAQTSMFGINDSDDWGKSAHPVSDDKVTLALEIQDPRTDAERETDARKAAEADTMPLDLDTD